MKIKSIAAICKKNKNIAIFERYSDDGDILTQYIGDGSAVYPVVGLPQLDKESLLTIFDVPEKDRDNYFVKTLGVPAGISFEDTDETERHVEREGISIIYSGRTLKPIRTTRGLVFIESRYLSPVADVLDVLELYERRTAEGTPYIVAKAGFLLQAVIMPYDVTVMTMSITAFESWIVNMLAEAIARKVEDLLINGTGSSQPKGIENANTWGATNSVTVAKTGALTAANVQTLIGLLPSGYDRNGKFVMNKKTLFTDFMPLQDNSKNHIVTVQNNAYFVYGYPVLLSDYVADHEAFLGDFKKVCANLAENIGVKSAYDIDTNSYKYSGIAIFDCAPAIGEAIVKLVKATA